LIRGRPPRGCGEYAEAIGRDPARALAWLGKSDRIALSSDPGRWVDTARPHDKLTGPGGGGPFPLHEGND